MSNDLSKYYKTKFRDVDIDLSLNPLTSDFVKLSHLESVKRRIKTLVLTQLYDRPYQPSLGSQVSGLLFEFAELEVLDMIEEMLIDLIRAFEPSVELLQVGVTEFQDGYGVRCNIRFSVIDFKEEAVLEIPLGRIR